MPTFEFQIILIINANSMKKTSIKKSVQRKPQPVLKWQTGDYDRHAEFKFVLPYPFLLLCRLVDKTPEDIIRDFADNLSCGSWKREGRDEAKAHFRGPGNGDAFSAYNNGIAIQILIIQKLSL